MFVDASAWTAILLAEVEHRTFMAKLAGASSVLTSAIANWEAIRAIGREAGGDIEAAAQKLQVLQERAGAQIVSIGEAEQIVALEAHARFGKGVHPAKLNMGDCFAYACAKLHGVALLYKGNDFALTDIEPA
jgi:ribonuclease VapC